MTRCFLIFGVAAIGCCVVALADEETDPTWAAGEDVVISSSSTVTVTRSTARLNSLTVAGRLVASGWETKIEAATVTVNAQGLVTCAGAFLESEASNRVWIVADDVTIAGAVNVSGCGYKGVGCDVVGQGPGAPKSRVGLYVGAAHGGWGGDIGTYAAGYSGQLLPSPYDDPLDPQQPGSAAVTSAASPAVGANGGGVIVIDAKNSVALSGKLLANGGAGSANYGGGGSGGTINVTCKTISGSGSMTAEGGVGTSWGGSGGGGCIAVTYDKTEQAKLSQPNLTFSTLAGFYSYQAAPRRSFETTAMFGEVGTVYFPDTALLKETLNVSGKIYLDTPKWSPDSLTITGVWAGFPQEGFVLDVKGDLIIQRRLLYIPGRLDIGGAEALQHCFEVPTAVSGVDGMKRPSPCRWRRFPRQKASYLHVGGDLKIGNGNTLCDLVIAAARLTKEDAYSKVPKGGLIRVDGTVTIDNGNALSLVSHMCTGVSPRLSCRNLIVKSGGRINADLLGWAGGVDAAQAVPFEGQVCAGFGPGAYPASKAVYYNWGAAHGGLAEGMSSAKYLYDDPKIPHMPGSGASGGTTGYGHVGSFGGGVIYAEVDRKATIAGALMASGGGSYGNHTGGGAGGSIYLKAATLRLDSTASFTAKGGSKANGGKAGGGGRIAVWRRRDAAASVLASVNAEAEKKTLFAAKTSVAGGNSSAGAGTVGLFLEMPLAVILR